MVPWTTPRFLLLCLSSDSHLHDLDPNVEKTVDALSEYNSAALPYKEERVVVIIQQKDSCHSHQCFLASKHEDMQTLDEKHLSLSLSLSLSSY